jgi:hypothetical protein
LPAYLGFLKAAQEWMRASNDLKRQADLMERAVDEISAVLPVIATAMKDRGKSGLDEPTSKALLELAKRGYFETAGAALARTPNLNATVRSSLVELALSRFKGDLFDPAQLEALHVLTWLLDGSESAKDIVRRVTLIFQNTGSPQNSYLTKFWIDAADTRSLPSNVIDDLLEQARAGAARTELEFFDYEVARVLAHAIADVRVEQRDAVYRLIDRAGASITPMSGTMAEMYGSLGRLSLDRPGMLEKVTAQLSGAVSRRKQPSADDDDKLPAMEITVGGSAPWAWALAAFGQHRKLSAEATNLLWQVAPVVQFKDDVEAAIAHQADLLGQCKDRLCIAPLTHSPTDSRLRGLEADLLAIQLSKLPREGFEAAIVELGELRKTELEPEARIALGRAIAGSRSRRYFATQPVEDISP